MIDGADRCNCIRESGGPLACVGASSRAHLQPVKGAKELQKGKITNEDAIRDRHGRRVEGLSRPERKVVDLPAELALSLDGARGEHKAPRTIQLRQRRARQSTVVALARLAHLLLELQQCLAHGLGILCLGERSSFAQRDVSCCTLGDRRHGRRRDDGTTAPRRARRQHQGARAGDERRKWK